MYKKEMLCFYSDSIARIDGIITGVSKIIGSKEIRVWSPVSKKTLNDLLESTNELIDIGVPQCFDYSMFDIDGSVLLHGKRFNGFYR